MIATLTGRVLLKFLDRAVVDVAGVGYEVILSTDAIARIPEKGEEIFLHIHTNVREDAIILFGFLQEEEKELFLILKTVSGIGPKLGLSMLSGLRVAEICQAITLGDIKRLTTLPGVGKKTAERICVDLKDKVAHLISTGVSFQDGGVKLISVTAGSVATDALSALMNLGYPDATAREALENLRAQLGDKEFDMLKVEVMTREALRGLA